MDAYTPGILLTIIGMGVVFGSLLVLMAVIVLLEKFVGSRPQETDAGAENADAAAQGDDLDLVLTAAAGYFLETESPDVFIPPVRRNADSLWARTARRGYPGQRRRR